MISPLRAVLPVSHPSAQGESIDLKELSRKRFSSLPDDEHPVRDAQFHFAPPKELVE
jgi:hypothetical protein